MKKLKTLALVIASTIAMSFSLTGCDMTEEDLEEMERYARVMYVVGKRVFNEMEKDKETCESTYEAQDTYHWDEDESDYEYLNNNDPEDDGIIIEYPDFEDFEDNEDFEDEINSEDEESGIYGTVTKIVKSGFEVISSSNKKQTFFEIISSSNSSR